MKKILFTLSFVALFSCKNSNEQQDATTNSTPKDITQLSDYEDHLYIDPASTMEQIDADIEDYQSILKERPNNILDLSKLASLLDKKFDISGDATYLNESVRLRESVLEYTAIKPENAKRALAQAYIKQHRFKKADSLVMTLGKGDLSKDSKYIMFDTAMELGNYEKAENLLNDLRNESDYNYLIRAAKWNDHQGRLDNTILNMEKALELAQKSSRTDWILWSNSNIADYYGHDGQIAKSYEHFLKTLELDKGNSYALKGIAWIAYSHDDQPDEALQILHTLEEKSNAPDYDLLLSEIYSYKGDEKVASEFHNNFMNKASKSTYGEMYNAYLIEALASGNKQQKIKALELAYLEIENRATPETYDLLGYALLMNEKESAALENHQTYVIGKTFEPVAQLHTAQIYKENSKDITDLKNELKEASYELGPVVMKDIEKL
jgi:hypothetical protein